MSEMFNSKSYWSERYRAGGTSGAGSYGRLAEFKAEVINGLVDKYGIDSVIEFGCGDGAQLSRAVYQSYLGFDVADESIAMCRSAFGEDSTKAFRNVDQYKHERADLTLSLDVIFHLIEDDVFEQYMRRLFYSANRFVVVYSSNYDGEWPDKHVKHRKFTDWVEKNHADFELVEHVPNRYPLLNDPQNETFADFYVFKKRAAKRHSLPGHLVVSVTSYAVRFPTLELTLRRILQQSVVPDETVLWISPRDAEHLPSSVIELQRCGLSIQITKDIRSYKKIIPALKQYPESFIITLDDDQIYPLDVLEPLIANYRSPTEVLCRRAHRIKFDERGAPLPYMQWQHEHQENDDCPDLFATGVCGILYPPHVLPPETLDEAKFLQLAPHADDIWLYWMARLANRNIRLVGRPWQNVMWPGAETSSLMNFNWNGGNDTQIAAMVEHFGVPRRPTPTNNRSIFRALAKLRSAT
ncbi:class I SAM-dependent methyltransferase [Caballeronia sp. INSB1]|uniref:class I SAM-dependent methyltransferase n=1 Tax=Caballeronia sp. INSB1 TaxID=2921751 RepID=UPI002032EFE1|nr:class I SAM-dependent methyltransferase [Caballeronia sp. INSB1]